MEGWVGHQSRAARFEEENLSSLPRFETLSCLSPNRLSLLRHALCTSCRAIAVRRLPQTTSASGKRSSYHPQQRSQNFLTGQATSCAHNVTTEWRFPPYSERPRIIRVTTSYKVNILQTEFVLIQYCL